MKHMVRTKIKGKSNTAASNEDVRVPNFDDLPPLPVSDRRPTAILDEMEHAILTMPIAFGAGAGAIAIAHCGSTMRTVSPPQPNNFTGDTNTDHQMIWPKTETPYYQVNVGCNQDESFQFLTPPLFYRTVSGESHHSPQLADTMESTQPIHKREQVLKSRLIRRTPICYVKMSMISASAHSSRRRRILIHCPSWMIMPLVMTLQASLKVQLS